MKNLLLLCMLLLAMPIIANGQGFSELSRDFESRLEYVGIAVEEPGYHVWGSSPVIGPDEKIHLFVARWPVKHGFGGWMTHCEIARYVGDSPAGPFKFKEVVVEGTGQETWDRQSPHNPTIQKIGDQYVLLYIANSGGEKVSIRAGAQRIGMQIADSPAGPWRKMGNDGMILSIPEDPKTWSHTTTVGVNNPALLAHPDGRFFLYYKAMKKGDVRRMGVAIADSVEGPYAFQPNPLTSNESEIEDGYAFCENGKIHLLTTTNKAGAGYLWSSEDGLNFSSPTMGFDVMQKYIDPAVVKAATNYRGRKFERPQILMKNGKAAWLYVASGANIKQGKGSCSYVLKINESKNDKE